ncbi:MAG TPA: tetratricopeptide repeat protein [Streptosporangiaceae bacterium]
MTTDIAISLGNLPAEPNSFIGRERDLAELALLVTDVRALTLCGPGGIGKTRLGLRLGWQLRSGFPDGSWLIELADVTDAELVARRVAATLGIRDEPGRSLADTLADALRPRRLLLVLDTCEHLIDASAALVQRLVASCPGLRVIATSREPLRLRGETVWRVPPLALPGQGAAVLPDELALQEAARLFAERAAAVRPGFTLNPGNAAAVAHVCRTLDGMPLAIELAAARVRALSVEQIAARLDDRFQLLASGDRTAPPRQQTLRAAVDWSYELLTDAEQTLLRRLSVFSGWDLDLAERVCADERIPAVLVLDLLAALIDKSLVTLDGELNGDARYRLLDTIRQYAQASLTASAEAKSAVQRHLDGMLQVAEQTVEQAFRVGDPPWHARAAIFRRAVADLPNYRSALAACLEAGDFDAGLRLCTALRSPWLTCGEVPEGVAWFDRFLGQGPDVGQAVLARALMARGELAFDQQDYARAAEFARQGMSLCDPAAGVHPAPALRVLALVELRAGQGEQALALADAAVAAAIAAADNWEQGIGLITRAAVLARMGRLDDAQRCYEDVLEVLRDNANLWGTAQALSGFGGLARARGEHAAALRHFRGALEVFRQIEARPEMARSLAGIGGSALAQGDIQLAAGSFTEALQLSLATGQRLAIARGLEAMALLALAQGDPERSLRLGGAAQSLREAIGGRTSPGPGTALQRLTDGAREQLGAAAAAALLEEGRAMDVGDAVMYAVASPPGALAGQQPAAAVTSQGAGRPTALTSRELEIAALIARGLSNRGIADELVISPATAARHVANIFAKLDFTSRAQVAAWYADGNQASR